MRTPTNMRWLCARGNKGYDRVPATESLTMIDENDPRLAKLDPDLRRRIAHHARDDAGCLIWHGPYCGGRTPGLYVPPSMSPTGRRGYVTVRRQLLAALFPASMTRRNVAPGVRCGDMRCVSPEHVFPSTAQQISKLVAARGSATDPARRAAIIRARRAQSRFTWADIEAIRASDERQEIVAQRYGIARSTVSAIRRHKIWKQNPGDGGWTEVFWRLAA